MSEFIRIRGARQHNLQGIDLDLPRNRLIVITGLSGSGKSSLAFDTLYAEGQRRYVESLSAYARQFLEQMDKPEVDLIEGLSPAVSIEQRAPSHNPRSTVATTTEIYDYLRLLFARAGTPHCPKCGRPIRALAPEEIVREVLRLSSDGEGTKTTRPGFVGILAPLVRGRIGLYDGLFGRLRRRGFTQVRVDGEIRSLEEKIRLDRYRKHTIELVVDRVPAGGQNRSRIADSVEIALREGGGQVLIVSAKQERLLSQKNACPECGVYLPEIEPRTFSFNSPYGACPACTGLGSRVEVDEDLVVPDRSKSVAEGALVAWADPVTTRTHRWKRSWSSWYSEILEDVCRRHRIAMDRPFRSLPKEHQKILLYGDGEEFEGVVRNLERRHRESGSEFVREEVYNRFMRRRTCPACKGSRLKAESLAVKIAGKSIAQICRMSVKEAAEFVETLSFEGAAQAAARPILKEIRERLGFLLNVGLDYLTLDRETQTLAGGEAQRIQLATQIGSGLTGVLYVLDEPTIGLHQRDNARLLSTLKRLRDLGNTLVVVEHDEETIRAADFCVDLGPGAGRHGGRVVYAGPREDFLKHPDSLTAKFLRGEVSIPVPTKRREPSGKYLEILGAAQFNLKEIDVRFPLGLFICVTGVSGSGKSTLVHEILYKAICQRFYRAKDPPGKHRAIRGLEHLDKVLMVDQSPIGRTPRSNPATYTDAWTPIRVLFSQLPEARARGWKAGRFSFNVPGGRCEKCKGDGQLKIEMQFLPDVYVRCDLCHGKRFNEETLEVRYKGKNIHEILEMSVEEASAFFENIPAVSRILRTLVDVGLGYVALGQSATTLSGGEAQRVKLAGELSRRATGRTLYILDEPTTGLHFADVEKLLRVLCRLVEAGNTVLVIEHNLDVVKVADWVVDLGPEGGDAGGRIVAEGPPEKIAASGSHTGRYLRRWLRPA